MKKPISNPFAKTIPFSRRQFLSKTTLAVGAAAFSFPYVGRVLGANDRINVACIGVGGKGNMDSSDASGCGGAEVGRSNTSKRPGGPAIAGPFVWLVPVAPF